jgi:hypothetical protein
MVTNLNSLSKLSEEELSEFEKVNQTQLPNYYREFLLKYNGGVPFKQKNRNPPTIVNYILGMHNGDYYSSLYKHIDMLGRRLPYSSLPIATDPFGNLFIMSLHPESYGHIYFWDHEREPEIQDGHNIDNISFVAYTFEEFINELK